MEEELECKIKKKEISVCNKVRPIGKRVGCGKRRAGKLKID